MSSPRVVRIARSDEATAFVLVHVCHTGPGALDLTLTATEGECPYSAILKQSLLKTLRVKNYQGTDEEWTRVICLVLGQSTGTEEPIPDGGIESFASIVGSGEEDKELVITIRKRVQAITQKLGAIVLRQDDEQAIELFEWANMSAARADALETRLIDSTNRHRTAEDTIQRLVEQLEGLMQTKSRHEHQLVANFTQVLNQKKLKIRNQQRLLASATSDPMKVSEIQAATWKRGGGEALQQRTKRGVSDISNVGDTGKGFEPMNVDEQKTQDSLIEKDIDEGGQSTPQSVGEDEDTATDDELDRLVDTTQSAAPSRQEQASRHSYFEAAPPRRQLLFIQRHPTMTAEASPVSGGGAVEGSTGDTDDDEL